MPISLNYDQVRALAKKLNARSGFAMKLTDVYEDIASSVGRKPDALMHELKTERKTTLKEAGARQFPEFIRRSLDTDRVSALTKVAVGDLEERDALVRVAEESAFEPEDPEAQYLSFARDVGFARIEDENYDGDPQIGEATLRLAVRPMIGDGERGVGTKWRVVLYHVDKSGPRQLESYIDVYDEGPAALTLVNTIMEARVRFSSERLMEHWHESPSDGIPNGIWRKFAVC